MKSKHVNKTKILMLSPALNAVSGVSTHVNMLLGSSLAQSYHLMHFQVGREGRDESRLQRIARFALSPLELASFLISHRPHILHINTSMDRKAFWRDFCYLVVARALGCRVITQFHSGFGPQKAFKNPLIAWAFRRFLLWSHVIVVISDQAFREHKKFDPRIQVDHVPNAIEATGLLDIPHAPPLGHFLRLVFVGRLVHTKGLFEAIDALAMVRAAGVHFTFKIAGSGPDEAELISLIAKHQLQREVKLLGPVFHEEKKRLWLDSDVFVFPTYFEGLPYSLLEAMAAGCVPVTCSVGGIPDVMTDGEHGLFVPVRDAGAIKTAICRLATDASELQRMSLAGRRRIAEQYTIDRVAARFHEIYQRMGQ